MVSRKVKIGLVLLGLVGVLCGRAAAQSSCNGALTSMAPCVNYITGNSVTPSSQCCSQLTSVVRSSPQCLCSVINAGGGSSFGLNINQTLALQLPGACNVQTPPVSQCNAANNNGAATPTSSPEGSPADDTPNSALTPSASDFPDGGSGSKTVPSTNGNNVRTPLSSAIFFVLAASCASVLTTF